MEAKQHRKDPAAAGTAAAAAALQDRGLIEGIAADARAEAERLVEEARRAGEERLKAAQAQSLRILQEAREKADSQARSVHDQALSSIRIEGRRTSLAVREEALRRVIRRARERLSALSDTDEYRRVLLGWIVEAAIGLNVPEALVNVSAGERRFLDPGLLREAERRVKELTGRKVSLKAASGDPLVGQGVVLVSADGRVEFNNQVSTRLLRYQSEIRSIVFEALDR